MEAHGGRIRAESGGPGRGTTITFTLPAAGEDRAASAPASASRDGRGGTSILVVDDDPHALRQMRDALAAAGYEPATAAGPGEVARLVETRRPALVVLDLMLPGTDGIELMRTLPALADLPVIFVSAYGRGETIARALEAGAADYIVKPFSPAELVARVGVALKRRAPPAAFVLGDLAIDRATRRVTVAGRAVRLTATEYKILALAVTVAFLSPSASDPRVSDQDYSWRAVRACGVLGLTRGPASARRERSDAGSCGPNAVDVRLTTGAVRSMCRRSRRRGPRSG